MMITSKGRTGLATTSQPSQEEQIQECCMCGDFGLSSELFRCKICQFRSQHRYCSNIYPKAKSYRACNWCLNDKEDMAEKAQNSLISSSPNEKTGSDDGVIKNKKKRIDGNLNNLQGNNLKSEKGPLKLNVSKHSIEKQRSPERSPLLAVRKRITTGGAIQESLGRTKSEDTSTSGIRKYVFKNKVRRYKLLDEVSS